MILTNEQLYDILFSEDIMIHEDISTDVFDFMVDETLTLDDVSKNSDKLDMQYEYVYKSFGFENFMDFYLYVNTTPETIEKGGAKNLSSLNKVKRTVVRNGKEIEMTVYEDDKQEEDKDKKQQENEPVSRNARDARSVSNGEEGKANPKKVANALSKLKKAGTDVSHMDANASMYKEFIDESGSTIGLTAFNITDTDVRLDAYASAPDSKGVGARAILELIQICIKLNKNAVVYDVQVQQAIEFLKMLGFKQTKVGFVLKRKEVQNFLGEYSELI